MMSELRRLRLRFNLWLNNRRHPPRVVIDRSGWATDRPQVHVSVASYFGSMGVYTWDSNDQGEACATMHGRDLAHITRLQLVDRRAAKRSDGNVT
jgi:hypothetical protein